jgi:hypothetical protein
LDDIRIHSDERAAQASWSFGASAYTIGSHIVFGRGNYVPHTENGQRLLLHELTHSLQQREAGATSLQRDQETPFALSFERDVYELELVQILGQAPTSASLSITDVQRRRLNLYLKDVRRRHGISDPLWEQSMILLLQGWFPGTAERLWEQSKRPLAGFVGTAFGGEARKRLAVAETEGLERHPGRRAKERLGGSDLIFFSGHHYARYGSPGEFDAIDLRSRRFKSEKARLLMVSSCAALSANSISFFRKRFPNATIFGWLGGSPLEQKGLMRDFITRLPGDVDVTSDAGIKELVRMWREFVERTATEKSSVSPYGLGYAAPDGKVTYYIRRKTVWGWETR